MATEIGGAVFTFDAKIDGFERGVIKIKSDFKQVEKEADRVATNASAAMRSFGGSMQALAGASTDPAKVAHSWSRATGQLASDMDRFSEEAKRQGITFAEMTQRLMHFKSAQWQASKGYGDLYKVMKEHDAEAAVMLRLSTSQAQSEAIVTAALARTTDATARAKIEAAAFGTTMTKVGKEAGAMSAGIGLAAKSMAAFLTIGAAVQGFAALRKGIKDVADIGDLAANVGMTTDELQELQYAFAATGLSAEESSGGLQRFAEKLADARKGEGELGDILKANNVSLTERDGSLRSSHAVLSDFADLLKHAASAEDALNMSVAVFGKTAGREFLEALRNGESGLSDMAKVARESGAVISESQIKAADEIDTRYNLLWERMRKGWQSAVVDAAGAADAFGMLWDQMDDLINQASGGLGLVDQYSNVLRKGNLAPGMSAELSRGPKPSTPAAPAQPTTVLPSVSDKFLADLRQETELLKLSNVERRTREALAKAGVAADSEQGKEIARLIRIQVDAEAADKSSAAATKEGTKARDEAADAARRQSEEIDAYVQSLSDEIKAIELETETLGLSESARARVIALAGLSADATEDQRKAALDAADALARKTAELEYAKNAEAMLAEATQQGIDATRAEIEAQNEAAQFLNSELSTSFFNVIDGTESVGEAFVRMSKKIIESMMEAVLFGNGPFANLFGSAGKNGSSGGLFSGLIGSLFKSAPMSLYATGGRTRPGKRVGVGEEGVEYFIPDDPNAPARALGVNGREMFTPDQPGQIVPNERVEASRSAMGRIAGRSIPEILSGANRVPMAQQMPSAASSSVSITMAPQYQIDARGAQVGVAEQMRTELDARDRAMTRKLPGMIRQAKTGGKI